MVFFVNLLVSVLRFLLLLFCYHRNIDMVVNIASKLSRVKVSLLNDQFHFSFAVLFLVLQRLKILL